MKVEQQAALRRAAAHQCAMPNSGLPGDEWTCSDCGQRWWADTEDSGPDYAFIEWREDD